MSVKSADPADDDAMTLLMHSQGRVRLLLERYAHLPDEPALPERRRDLMHSLCGELAAHLRVEEELLFPPLRDRLSDPAPLERAEVEHACLRELVEQLRGRAADAPLSDARMHLLATLVELRFNHELRELYPMTSQLDPRWSAIGQQLARRRQDLLSAFAQGHGAQAEFRDEARAGAVGPVGRPPR